MRNPSTGRARDGRDCVAVFKSMSSEVTRVDDVVVEVEQAGVCSRRVRVGEIRQISSIALDR